MPGFKSGNKWGRTRGKAEMEKALTPLDSEDMKGLNREQNRD